jgi:type VI secretion system secreted protein Hcp
VLIFFIIFSITTPAATQAPKSSFIIPPQKIMKKFLNFLCFSFLLVSFATEAQNIYLFYPPASNDVGTGIHQDEIILSSLQGGIGRGVSSGNPREASAPSISEYVCTKQFDKSSVRLMQLATNGNGDSDCEIRFYVDEVLVYKIELADVLISGFSASSAGGSGTCTNCPDISESLSLNFTKVRATDLTQIPNVVFQWDLVLGKPSY